MSALKIVSGPMPRLGSSPRDDLRSHHLVQQHKPKMRAEFTFQQFDGTDLCAWHARSGAGWHSVEPVFQIGSQSHD